MSAIDHIIQGEGLQRTICTQTFVLCGSAYTEITTNNQACQGSLKCHRLGCATTECLLLATCNSIKNDCKDLESRLLLATPCQQCMDLTRCSVSTTTDSAGSEPGLCCQVTNAASC
ncbi:hypothetical protein M758_10G012200 [Ceratodon purpureus]|nr:hypothetical protein M758_10G012200 [Ceratodon purpureus]